MVSNQVFTHSYLLAMIFGFWFNSVGMLIIWQGLVFLRTCIYNMI